MKKYIAYIRVSTEKQGRSGLGLEAQREIITHYAGSGDILDWYEEVHSGKNLDALPLLQQAKDRAKKEGLILILAKTDRLRNTAQALDLVDELTPEGVFFCNVGPNADKFTLTLFFAFAERERTETSLRTKAAMAAKKARGIPLGRTQNFTPEGRKKGAQANRLKALNDPETQKATAQAMAFRKDGLTLEEIAEKLNKLTYRTPNNKLWAANSVHRILGRV